MKLLIPLGLIALIAIPIIIIIYIIKPKYTEKRISSTYIWKLSMKYKKKKMPLQWLQRSLLLILQILSAFFMAFMIAKPIIEKKIKSEEKIIILDASASMNALSSKNETRFNRALNSIKKDAKKVSESSKLTIILADDEPYYVIKQSSNTNEINTAINNLKATYGTCNISNAISLANDIQDINNDANVFFYTDHQYEKNGYIDVVDFSDGEYNVSITNFKYEIVDGFYTFNADISSYNGNLDAKILLNINDGYKFVTQKVSIDKNKTTHLSFNDLGLDTISSAKLSIVTNDSTNTNYKLVNDSFEFDNEVAMYEIEKPKFKVLSIGENTSFVNASFTATGICDVDTINPESKEIKNEDYDLYIYDNYYPEVLPHDGTILIINPSRSDERLNYEIVSSTEGSFYLVKCDEESKIVNNLSLGNINIGKFSRINLLANYKVLLACNNYPALIEGNYNRAKVIVMTFDLHYSNLPLSKEMVILSYNLANALLNYTIENNNLYINDTVTINSNSATTNTLLDDNLIYDDTYESLTYETKVTKPGIHKVVQKVSNNIAKTNYFFAKVNEEESNFNFKGKVLTNDSYAFKNISINNQDAFEDFDIVTILAAILLLFLALEWGISYHEQN